jgi:hypothetical protein
MLSSCCSGPRPPCGYQRYYTALVSARNRLTLVDMLAIGKLLAHRTGAMMARQPHARPARASRHALDAVRRGGRAAEALLLVAIRFGNANFLQVWLAANGARIMPNQRDGIYQLLLRYAALSPEKRAAVLAPYDDKLRRLLCGGPMMLAPSDLGTLATRAWISARMAPFIFPYHC